MAIVYNELKNLELAGKWKGKALDWLLEQLKQVQAPVVTAGN